MQPEIEHPKLVGETACGDIQAARTLRSNGFRRREFQTRTVISEQSGRKMVYKYACSAEAESFLDVIVQREKQNAEFFQNHFEVARGTLVNGRLEYEYLPWVSLQDQIGEALRARDFQRADQWFREYVNRLNSLPTVHARPEEFFRVIGGSAQSLAFEVNCLARGLLDLTPRNILVNDNRWMVLDNEWSFDFPVPMIFILFRAVKEMAMMLQDDILSNVQPHYPAVGLFARNTRTYYVPQSWLWAVTDDDITFREMLGWEFGFQRYVTGTTAGMQGRIKRHPKFCTHGPHGVKRRRDEAMQRLKQPLKRVPGLRRMVLFLDRAFFSLAK